MLGKGSGIHRVVTLEFHYCKPPSISKDYHTAAKSISATCESLRGKSEAYQHQLASRHAGAVMIFTHSRNAATDDNSMYCMIPDPFPSTAFGKGSVTPD